MPGVTAAGFASFLPMSSFRGGIWPVPVKGDANADVGDSQRHTTAAGLRYVTPGFFEAMGTRITRGRNIAATDTRDRPFVAVVSESFGEAVLAESRSDRAALHIRVRRARGRGRGRRRALPRPGAGERAAGVSVIAAGRRRQHRVLRAEVSGHSHARRAVGARAGGSRCDPARRPEAPDYRAADAHDPGGSRNRHAHGAGSSARNLCRHRVRAGRSRHSRPAVVRRVAAHAGDWRAQGTRRAVGRHPVDGGASAACCWPPRASCPASSSRTSPAAAWRRSSPASSLPTRRRSPPPSVSRC